MWQSLKYVTGFFSLAAFLGGSWISYQIIKARQLTKWIRDVPEGDKLAAIDRALGRFHVDTEGLTKSQKFKLLKLQVKERRWWMGLCFLLAILLAILSFVSILFQPRERSTLTGYVYYEQSSEKKSNGAPVEGADVQIVGTQLHATTQADGGFAITDLPVAFEAKEVRITRGGKFFDRQTSQYPDHRFLIPRDVQTVRTDERPFALQRWQLAENSDCSSSLSESNGQNTAQFSLGQTVPTEVGYSNLIVRISCPDELNIINAHLTPETGIKMGGAEDSLKSQKWRIPITADNTSVAISVCVGSRKKAALSGPGLVASYWFEKID